MSWHTKSSSVHLQVFFYSFPALTLILLMIKHLKHFKTKLFTFRYFFFPLYEKDRYLAGIYLPTCSLAPQPKNILKHVPFHLGALYVPTTHSLIFLFYFILFRGWFIFFSSPFLLSPPLCAADHMVSFTETADCKTRQTLWLCRWLSWLLYLWRLHSPLITCPWKSCREGAV